MPTVSFNNCPMLVEAAIAGDGIALGWRHLSEALLEQRRLARPVDEE
jgi:DNA-binding transcriptional LysR family regulator